MLRNRQLVFLALVLFIASVQACHKCYKCTGQFSEEALLAKDPESTKSCLNELGVEEKCSGSCFTKLFLEMNINDWLVDGGLEISDIRGSVKIERGCSPVTGDYNMNCLPKLVFQNNSASIWKNSCKKMCKDHLCNTETLQNPFLKSYGSRLIPNCRTCRKRLTMVKDSFDIRENSCINTDKVVAVEVCIGLCYISYYFTDNSPEYIVRGCLKRKLMNFNINIDNENDQLGNYYPNQLKYYNRIYFCKPTVGSLCNGHQSLFNFTQLMNGVDEMSRKLSRAQETTTACIICTGVIGEDGNTCHEGLVDVQFQKSICYGMCFIATSISETTNKTTIYRGCSNEAETIVGTPSWMNEISYFIEEARNSFATSYTLSCKLDEDFCWYVCKSKTQTCNAKHVREVNVKWGEYKAKREEFSALISILSKYFNDEFLPLIDNDFNDGAKLFNYINSIYAKKEEIPKETEEITHILNELQEKYKLTIYKKGEKYIQQNNTHTVHDLDIFEEIDDGMIQNRMNFIMQRPSIKDELFADQAEVLLQEPNEIIYDTGDYVEGANFVVILVIVLSIIAALFTGLYLSLVKKHTVVVEPNDAQKVAENIVNKENKEASKSGSAYKNDGSAYKNEGSAYKNEEIIAYKNDEYKGDEYKGNDYRNVPEYKNEEYRNEGEYRQYYEEKGKDDDREYSQNHP